ncbi:MAG: hypothetical protein K8R21_03705 [Leptospira sp.]|nr:hypothetical protein [Leptospira sp.]
MSSTEIVKRDSFTPRTDLTFDSSEERKTRAAELLLSLKNSMLEMVISLREIRDRHLYKEMSYASFTDFIELGFPINPYFAEKLLVIADNFGTGDEILSLAQSNTSEMFQLAKNADVSDNIDDEGIVTMKDGTKMHIRELIGDLKKEIKQVKGRLTKKEEMIEKQNKEIERTNTMIEEISHKTGLTEEEIGIIANRKEAVGLIDKTIADFNKQISQINAHVTRHLNPEKPEQNAEIVGRIQTLLEVMNISIANLNKTWDAELFTFNQGKNAA